MNREPHGNVVWVRCIVGHSAHGQMSDRSFSSNTSKGAAAKYGGGFSQNGQQGAKRYQAWTVNTPTHPLNDILKQTEGWNWNILKINITKVEEFMLYEGQETSNMSHITSPQGNQSLNPNTKFYEVSS